MRPATAYSADGPANLLQAVTAAASPSSKERGALITINDRVGSAFYTQKTHGEFSCFSQILASHLGGVMIQDDDMRALKLNDSQLRGHLQSSRTRLHWRILQQPPLLLWLSHDTYLYVPSYHSLPLFLAY